MKGIVLKQWEVQAILDGRKSRLTRPVKFKYGNTHHKMRTDKYGTRLIEIQNDVEGETFGKNKDGTTWQKLLGYIEPKPQYKVGDILFVKETFCNGPEGKYLYKMSHDTYGDYGNWDDFTWKPSIHMPIDAARTFLKVTGVRVERLQDIQDCKENIFSEGIREYTKDGVVYKYAPHVEWMPWSSMPREPWVALALLWDSFIKGKDFYHYGWDANPWVFIYEFERISKEEAYEQTCNKSC